MLKCILFVWRYSSFNRYFVSGKARETIGIVGKTGSGKTTLIKLLAKMYDIETGSILINDKNIKELDVKDFTSIYVLYPKTVEFLTHCL